MAKPGRKSNAERAARAANAASGNLKPEGSNDGAVEQERASDGFVDPGQLGSAAGAGSASDGNSGDSQPDERRTRSDSGRKRGPRKSAPLDLTDLKDIVVMAHAGIAIALQSDLIGIDDAEGEKLAGAIQKVLRHYDLPDVASETKDWIGLIIVASSIYGPRVAAAWARKSTPPPAPTAEQADNVVNGVVFHNPAMRP